MEMDRARGTASCLTVVMRRCDLNTEVNGSPKSASLNESSDDAGVKETNGRKAKSVPRGRTHGINAKRRDGRRADSLAEG